MADFAPFAVGQPAGRAGQWGEQDGANAPIMPHLDMAKRAPNVFAGHSLRSHAPSMFTVTEAEAAAIRAAFDRGGELSAAVELRRLFPGVTDNAQARECARIIAGWKPLPLHPPGLPRSRHRET